MTEGNGYIPLNKNLATVLEALGEQGAAAEIERKTGSIRDEWGPAPTEREILGYGIGSLSARTYATHIYQKGDDHVAQIADLSKEQIIADAQAVFDQNRIIGRTQVDSKRAGAGNGRFVKPKRRGGPRSKD
jgi:hypothetical protein